MNSASLRLLLHGDQGGSRSRDADRRLLSTLGVATPHIGYVSAAPDADRIGFEDRAEHYAGLGASLRAYVDESNASTRTMSQLEACHAIHLSGGNTFTFAHWLRQSKLFEALRHYALNGGALIGVSAGAIMLTPSVTSAALCGDFRPPEVVEDSGLSLVPFGFWPHFNKSALRSPDAHGFLQSYESVYACPDGCAVLVQGAKVECIGKVELFNRDD